MGEDDIPLVSVLFPFLQCISANIRPTWTEKVPKCLSLSCKVLRLSQNAM